MNKPSNLGVSIDPLAICESEDVGEGTRIWPFAHVMFGATIGRDCNICGQVFVESGALIGDRVTVKNGVFLWDKVVVEDDVFLGPGATFTNDPNPRSLFKKSSDQFSSTFIRQGATIGAGAVILCGLEVGASALVGAGSVVVSSVPPHALVVGNPAHQIDWICTCGLRLGESWRCECGRSFRASKGGLEQIPPAP